MHVNEDIFSCRILHSSIDLCGSTINDSRGMGGLDDCYELFSARIALNLNSLPDDNGSADIKSTWSFDGGYDAIEDVTLGGASDNISPFQRVKIQ